MEKKIKVTGYINHTREGFLRYLQETLIPDLVRSGEHCMAEDLMVCVEYMKHPEKSNLSGTKMEVECDDY